jgi:hypothetical protein
VFVTAISPTTIFITTTSSATATAAAAASKWPGLHTLEHIWNPMNATRLKQKYIQYFDIHILFVLYFGRNALIHSHDIQIQLEIKAYARTKRAFQLHGHIYTNSKNETKTFFIANLGTFQILYDRHGDHAIERPERKRSPESLWIHTSLSFSSKSFATNSCAC